MLQIKYETLRSTEFMNAISKLANHPFKDQKLAYSIAKMLQKIKKEGDLAQDLFLKLLDQWAEKDEKGALKPVNESMPGTFSIPTENEVGWKAAYKEFEEVTIEIPLNSIRLEQLSSIEFTARELLALEPVLTVLELVEPVEQGPRPV